MSANGAAAYAEGARYRANPFARRGEPIDFRSDIRVERMTVSLTDGPHPPKLVERFGALASGVALSVDEGHDGIACETSDTVSEPFTGDEDRCANVEAEGVILERRSVPVPHEEADQALVGLVHLILAARKADTGGVDDREVGCHRAVEADEAVIEDANRVLGYDSVGRGHSASESSRGTCRNLRLVLSVVEARLLPGGDRFEGVPVVLRATLFDGGAEHDRLPAPGRGAVPALGGSDSVGVPLRAEARRQPAEHGGGVRGPGAPARRPARTGARAADQRPRRGDARADPRVARPGDARCVRPRAPELGRDRAAARLGGRRPGQRPRPRGTVPVRALPRTALLGRRPAELGAAVAPGAGAGVRVFPPRGPA